MAEMKATSVVIVLVLVGIVGFLVLTFGGWMSLGWFSKGTFDKGLAVAQGYTAAKTPAEAMDQFRSAIQARNYKNAAYYCTKEYAEYLTRTHAGAAELGADIDQIRAFGDKGGIVSDKLVIILHKLDPFPLNFKVGPAPKENAKGKTIGSFEWSALVLKNPGMLNQFQLATDVKDLDWSMLNNLLGPPDVFLKSIELVKEGEEWKLNIPTNQVWDKGISNFLAKHKAYHTGLHQFTIDMGNGRYDSAGVFEGEVINKLRSAAR